ncbi:Cin1p NDAI_0E03790 [Naumovozyma dairenensis CBS 421]|uniref:Tubulin-folding cofactor D ARM repeats domain-containing protein n=1 Tax=Naumovozyma dairenensis (strain ATCC 10597 / BCRC 20456 / CBS 421 / NBRC 0211 / NRRL Y-12639) TaxID=1071378 RepID=G0WBS6_NAUDC|nr:hypothetical protein NDAI_0E03790 [Naumovozyma dairenensis CBS 421]CCD25196.1 hypothetical protein NDAI_0E03790 [Naumovozyma dairenensis CBS 421]
MNKHPNELAVITLTDKITVLNETSSSYSKNHDYKLLESNVEEITVIINSFQNDPSILEKKLHIIVPVLLDEFFEETKDITIKIFKSKIFYNLSKVTSLKATSKFLTTNVFLLPLIMNDLKSLGKSTENRIVDIWYLHYLLLASLNTVVQSPFDFKDNYAEIIEAINSFKNNQLFITILCQIRAQLYFKNKEKSKHDIEKVTSNPEQNEDLLTLNYYLKLLIVNAKSIDIEELEQFFLTVLSMEKLTCFILNSASASASSSSSNRMNILNKLLPKLFILNGYFENWDALEQIISWYLSHFSNQSTDTRFIIAHSFKKILNTLCNELKEVEMAQDILINDIILTTASLLKEKSWDMIDIDFLHTNLLIIAESIKYIANSLTSTYLLTISNEIIPKSLTFQQLQLKSIKGNQIKDATNFICWSLARSRSTIPIPVLDSVFLNLLTCSLFDHAYIIRKSSTAALQELLGRYGTKILDHPTIMKIIELPINDIDHSYSENIITLYSIFNVKFPEYWDFIISWLFDTNIFGTNFNLGSVKLTAKSFTSLSNHVDTAHLVASSNFNAKLFQRIQQFIKAGKSSKDRYQLQLDSAKIVYLLIELILRTKIAQDKDVLQKYRNFLDELITNFKAFDIFKRHRNINSNRLFQYTVILKIFIYHFASNYEQTLKFTKDDCYRFFSIVKSIPTRDPLVFKEFDNLTKQVISVLSDSIRSKFENNEVAELFWKEYEKQIKSNNLIVCSSLPKLEPRHFSEIFYKQLQTLSCQSKSKIIDSLTADTTKFQLLITSGLLHENSLLDFLNDYTITEQGDVGRLVRTSACELISKNKNILLSGSTTDLRIISKLIPSLIRISTEPATELKKLAFTLLSDIFKSSNDDSKSIHCQLLTFYDEEYIKDNTIYMRNFWKGYMMTLGAVHATDEDLTESLNEFIRFYNNRTSNDEKLELCNELIKIIPRATELTQENLKFTIISLNFWERLFQSGIRWPFEFNIKGVYAKLYNLHLVEIHSDDGMLMLKLGVLRLFPHLCVVYQDINNDNPDLVVPFVNTIIKRLLVLIQRKSTTDSTNSIKKKRISEMIKRSSIESLLQILLEFEMYHELKVVKSACKSDDVSKSIWTDDTLPEQILLKDNCVKNI